MGIPVKKSNGLSEAIYSIGKGINKKGKEWSEEIESDLHADSDYFVPKKLASLAAKNIDWVNPIPTDDLSAVLMGAAPVAMAGIKPLTHKVKKIVGGLRAQEAPVPIQRIITLLKKSGLKNTELEDAGVPKLHDLTNKGNIKPATILEKLDEIAPKQEGRYSPKAHDTWTIEAEREIRPKDYTHAEYYIEGQKVPRPHVTEYKKGHMNFGDELHEKDYPFAHSRSSSMTTSEGKKARVVQEVQSDMHQAAERLGYAKDGQRLSPEQEQAGLISRYFLDGEYDLQEGELAQVKEILQKLSPTYAKDQRSALLRAISSGVEFGDYLPVEKFKDIFPKGVASKTQKALKEFGTQAEALTAPKGMDPEDFYFVDDVLGSDDLVRKESKEEYKKLVSSKDFKYREKLRKRLEDKASLPQAVGRASEYDLMRMEAFKGLIGDTNLDIFNQASEKLQDPMIKRVMALKRLAERNRIAARNSSYMAGPSKNYFMKNPAQGFSAAKAGLDSKHLVRDLEPDSLTPGPFSRYTKKAYDLQNQAENARIDAAHQGEKFKNLASGEYFDIIPDIPFKRTWEREALKDEIRRAVEGNYDMLTIANPRDLHTAVQPKRFFTSITYDPATTVFKGITRDGQEVVEKIAPEKLYSYVGDDAARELLETGSTEGVNTIKPGFANLYESELPSIVDDIFSRHGINVPREQVTAHAGTKPPKSEILDDFLYGGDGLSLSQTSARLMDSLDGQTTQSIVSEIIDALDATKIPQSTRAANQLMSNRFPELLARKYRVDPHEAWKLIDDVSRMYSGRQMTTRPMPAWNLQLPEIRQMVQDGFPLGALLAGILGYGAYEGQNNPSVKQAALGM